MNSDTLFEAVGFVNKFRTESEDFFRPYFENDDALYDFFCLVFKNDSVDNKPRQIMNDIRRFVSLANDVDLICPDHDPLRILFLRICLESICKDSGLKKKDFFNSFDSFFSETGTQYILTNFVFTGILVPDELTGDERAKFNTHSADRLTCSDFLRIMYATRNMVVHGGDYWSMQFFARDTESVWTTCMTTKEEMLSCQKEQEDKEQKGKEQEGKELTYCFQTTMHYEKLVFYFVEACINFLRSFIKNLA